MSLYKGTQLIAGGGSGGGSEEDNLSITKNASDKIQTVGVIDQNDSTSAIKVWTGALADLPATKDPATLYNITDDVDAGESVYTKTEVDTLFANMLGTLYPTGSVYIGTQASCPLASLIPGSTWELVAQDRSLQGSSTNHAAGSTIAAGLPNITGSLLNGVRDISSYSGAFYSANNLASMGASDHYSHGGFGFDASRSSSVYGNSFTVQPPAYVVNVWRRTA